MRVLCNALLVVIAGSGAALCNATAQGPPAPPPTGTGIEGVVVDSAGRPVARARLVVRDTTRTGDLALKRTSVESDSLGNFRVLGIAPGPHVLEVTRDEYEPAGFQFSIETGVTARVRITLQRDPLWAEMQRAADSIVAAEQADSIARAAAIASAPASLAAGAASAQFGRGLLFGRVATPDGKAVASAQIQAMGTAYAAVTDSAGRFRFRDLPVGPYFLRARKVGFEPVVFSANVMRGDSLDAAITLEPISSAAQRLGSVRVTADADRSSRRLQGFLARKAAGRGFFIERSEIEQRRPSGLSDLLRGRANVTVQRNGASGDVQVFGPRLSISSGYCPLALIVDGTLIANAQGSIDNYVPPDMVLGIEVYNSGTSVPSEFARLGTDCGAIIVWTR